jgi:bacterioferritin-associated ferredoxin
MLVCHCHGVNERQIRRLVSQGASTVSDVRAASGAGSGCGGCLAGVAEIVGSDVADRESADGAAESTQPSA